LGTVARSMEKAIDASAGTSTPEARTWASVLVAIMEAGSVNSK
jgi:hypothetical protein